MPAPLYRFDWKPCAAYVRTEDAAMIAELGRFLDIGPEREENDPPDAGETTVTIEETNGMFYIATSDWRVRAHTRAQLLFAALEGLGQIFVHGFFPAPSFMPAHFKRTAAPLRFSARRKAARAASASPHGSGVSH